MTFKIWNGFSLEFLVAFVLVSAWIFLRIPELNALVGDNDGGHQLLGAFQIIHLNEHPFLDFFSSYGPLAFYFSAVFQKLSHETFLGEVMLRVMGFLVTYLALWWVIKKLVRDFRWTIFLLILALIWMPVLYKYYAVLTIMIWIVANYSFLRYENEFGAFAMGASVAFAGLFRHDFGGYTMVASIIAFTISRSSKLLLKRFFFFIAGAILVFSPWLLLLWMNGKIFTYFKQIWTVTFGVAEGLSLPNPALAIGSETVPFGISIAYIFVYLIPVFSLLMIVIFRQKISTFYFRFGICLVSISFMNLLQSAHRSDFGHLIQATIPSFVLLSWLTSVFRQMPTSMNRAMQFSLLGVSAWIVLFLTQPWTASLNFNNLKSPIELLRNISKSKSEIRQMAKNDFFGNIGQLIVFIHDNANPEYRVNVFPFLPQVQFISERGFSGGSMLLAPGFFTDLRSQVEIVERLAKTLPKIVLWDENYCFDGLENRNSVKTHYLVYNFIVEKYVKDGMVGSYTVYRKNLL